MIPERFAYPQAGCEDPMTNHDRYLLMVRVKDSEFGYWGVLDISSSLAIGDSFQIDGDEWLIVHPYATAQEFFDYQMALTMRPRA